jgi:hypothetical protein
MGAAACIVGLWLQVVEVWPSGMRLVIYPDLERQGPIAGVFVAWPHPSEAWEIGDFFRGLFYHPSYPSDRTRRLREWADSLGLVFSTWSGPEGAALIAEVPWSYKMQALQWLHAVVGSLELGDEHLYRWAVYRYYRQAEGLQLSREIALRRRGWKGKPPSYEAVKNYFYAYLRPESLWVGVFGRLTLREKASLRRLWALWRTPASDSISSEKISQTTPSADTVEENLWAYPIYGSAWVETPNSWPERLAFVEALLSRWQREAPPLQFRGAFEGRERYSFDVRLDGKSYQYLRRLTHLAVRDSAEAQAWQMAYVRRCLRLRGEPARYPDMWIGALLRGDSVALPDTLPDTLWWRGWKVSLRGLWLVQELYALDTLEGETKLEPPVALLPDTISHFSPFETLWVPPRKGAEPPLEAWAAAMQHNLTIRPLLKWVLMGYYRHRRGQASTLRRLHAWRKVLIQQYKLPPQALQVQVRPASPDIPPKVIRVICVGS